MGEGFRGQKKFGIYPQQEANERKIGENVGDPARVEGVACGGDPWG